MKVKFLFDTYLKASTENSRSLPIDQKVIIKAGAVHDLHSYSSKEGNHIKVAFKNALFKGKNTWFIYAPHVELFDPDAKSLPKDLLLPVPWFPQTDNQIGPDRTCNSSSCAMCLEFLKPGTLQGTYGDDRYVEVVFKFGDTTDHTVQTQALEEFGVNSTWHTNLDFKAVYAEIEAGKPVVIGILHRGELTMPTGGHMIVVRGYTKEGDFVVNDPYGSLLDGYAGAVQNGRNVVYSKHEMSYRWTADGPGTGWGRTFN